MGVFCCLPIRMQNAHNVLVASSPVACYGLVAKISDLGLSRVLKQHATHRTTHTVSWSKQDPLASLAAQVHMAQSSLG
jgi:hypothetical protein